MNSSIIHFRYSRKECSVITYCMQWTTQIHSLYVVWDPTENFLRFVFLPVNFVKKLIKIHQLLHCTQTRQKDNNDILGVEYYLFLPFQHLSKYQSFMDRIINTLNIDNETAVMAACSKAIKNIERLIKDMHSSWSASDVQSVRKRPIRKLSNLVLNGIQNIRRHWWSGCFG